MIETTEPTAIDAGTTVRWRRVLAEFPPSDGWSLSYAIRGPDEAELAVPATVDGDEFAVEIPAATTQGWAPGRYAIAGYVEQGAGPALERHRVYAGALLVRAYLADVQGPYEARSHARRVLEAIEAVLEGRASKDQESYTIQGRTLVRTPIDQLLKLRDRYRAEVLREEDAEGLAAGLGSRRTIRTRLGRGY